MINMINGLVKMFYSDVVKSNIKNLKPYPEEGEIVLKKEGKMIKEVSSKIDNYIIKILKIVMISMLLLTTYNVNNILGIGIFITAIAYVVYKNLLQDLPNDHVGVVKDNINNIKVNINSNVEKSKSVVFTEKNKANINTLVILAFVGIVTEFSLIISICMGVVLVCIIKEMFL